MKKQNLEQPPQPPIPIGQMAGFPDMPTIDGDLQAKIKELKKHKGLNMGDKFRMRNKPSRAFLITMRYSNGTRKSFIITTSKETFKHKGRTYYLYYENAFFDISHSLYHLDFFDDFCCPIDREIIKLPDKDAPKGQERAYFSVSPHNLRPLLAMEYVKSLAQSQELNKYLKLTLLFSLLSLVMTLLIVYKIFNV